MDHDRLFKELLTTFFTEFLQLFFPKLAAELDRDRIEFADKEVFTDIGSGDRHEVDLLAEVHQDTEPCGDGVDGKNAVCRPRSATR